MFEEYCIDDKIKIMHGISEKICQPHQCEWMGELTVLSRKM